MIKHKKCISIILILLIVFHLIPKEGFATKFTHNLNNKTVQKLLDDSYKEYNMNGLPINPYVYNDYGIVVWGDWSDIPNNEETREGEHRYLGQDFEGNEVTNDIFENDDTSSIPLPNKNWQKINLEENGWGQLEPIQVNQILYAKPIRNDGYKIEYSIADILKNRADMRKYIIIQNKPTKDSEGSVRLQHKTKNNKIWYDTFTIPRLPYDKITIKYINITNNQQIQTHRTENMESGTNFYDIPQLGGYEFQYWVLDSGEQKKLDPVQAISNSDGTEHELIIYYKLVGDISAILEMTANPDYVDEGKTADIEVKLDASKSSARYKIDSYKFEASLDEDFSDAKVVNTVNDNTTVIFKDVEPNTTIYGHVTVTDDDTGQTATATAEILIGKSAGGGEHNPYDYEIYARFDIDDPILKDKKEDIVFQADDINFKDNSYNPRVRFNNKDPEFDGVNQWEFFLELGPSLTYTDRFKFSTNETRYKPKIYTKEELNTKVNRKITEFLNEHIDEIVNKGRERIFMRIHEEAREVEGFDVVLDDDAYREISIFLTGDPTLTKHYIDYTTGEEIKTETKTIPFLHYYLDEKYPFKIYSIDKYEFLGWKKEQEQEYWEFSYPEGDYYIGKYKVLGPRDVDVYLYFKKIEEPPIPSDPPTEPENPTADLNALIDAFPKQVYVGQQIKVSNYSTGDYLFQWYINDRGTPKPKDGFTMLESVPCTKTVKLKIWDNEGNEDEAQVTVRWIDVSLDAKIAASPSTAMEGDIINISNLSTGDYDSWKWTVNGETKFWGKEGGEFLAREGNNNISLYIEHTGTGKNDSDSCTVSAQRPNLPPNALFKAPNYVIRGQTIDVTDMSTDSDGTIVRRQWSISGSTKYTSDLSQSGAGGSIVVDEFTTITVKLTVWDDDGDADSYVDNIVVGGNEEIDIKINDSGTKKVNRKYSVDLSNSTVGDYYNINWANTKYTFIPISRPKLDIKYKIREKGIDILSKKTGIFDLKIDMKDTGSRIKSKTIRVNIMPDIPPIVNNSVDKTVTFRPEEVKFDSEIYSSDNDIIQIEWNRMYYDSDNDGDYEEERGVDISKGNIKFDEVGKYKIVGFAKEEFGQETIEEFVTDVDRLETRVEIVVQVENMSPKAEIETDIPPQMEKVDVMLILDQNLDTKNQYKVHDLDTGLDDLTHTRDYLKGSISEFVNKFKGKQVDSKLSVKDLKTDKYLKTVTESKNGDYATNNDNNFSDTYSYNLEGFSGILQKIGVSWSERRVNVTENFTKYESKNSLSRNSSIFNSNYYVNESRNISNNPATKFATTADFSGNIPRKTVSWRSNYDYFYNDITETEYKPNLTSKDESLFSDTKDYNSGGYSGTLTKTGVSWTANFQTINRSYTDSVTKTNLASQDSSVFLENMSVPASITYNGKTATAVTNSAIPRTNISWTETIIEQGDSKTATDFLCIIAEDKPTFQYSIPYDSGGYTGTLYKSGSPVKGDRVGGSQHSDNFQGWHWHQYYSGTVTKPEIKGYNGTASYGGSVIYQYESSYNGTASYSGQVSKAVFRNYTGTATYQGNLTTYNVLDGYNGTANYRGRVTKLEKENSEPDWNVGSPKYIIYVSDSQNNNLDILNKYKQQANAKVVVISTEEASADNNIAFTSIEENMDEAIDIIASENPPIMKSAVLINEETFNTKTKNSDPENDNIIIEEIKFFHDPDYYLNSLGITSLSQDWQDAKNIDMNNITLDKPGQYIISYRVQDEPKADSKFDEYKKYSNEAQASIFAHRRPIVTDFDINFLYNPSTGKYEDPEFEVQAYDPDYYVPSTGEGRSDKGILAYDFRWKRKEQPDTEYQYGIPTSLDAGIYNIEVRARDIDYAWSFPYTIEIELTDTALDLDAELYPEKDEFDILDPGIPASEELKVINIETIHAYPIDRIEFALYSGSTRKTPLITLKDPDDVNEKNKSKTIWEDIRNYQIPETLPDGTYVAKIKAIAGAVSSEITWNVVVNTPINLQPVVESTLITEEDSDIGATTSIYANTVTVTMFKDTIYEYNVILNNTAVDVLKRWNKVVAIPAIPEGDYELRYRATTPNGNVEIKDVTLRVVNVKLENLRIEKINDPLWEPDKLKNLYSYPITQDKMPAERYLNKFNADIKKGYSFEFALDSMGLNQVDDEVVITPEFFYSSDGLNWTQADIYYHINDDYYIKVGSARDKVKVNTSDEEGFDLIVLKNANKSISGNTQTWNGRYYISPNAVATEKDADIFTNSISSQEIDQSKIKEQGYIKIRFNIRARKNGSLVNGVELNQDIIIHNLEKSALDDLSNTISH